jgi:spermidine synthase
VGILFLPAFFMGGTLPLMGQYLVRSATELGRTATVLYAINTLGAASGALLAGFYLPFAFGYRNSYFVAIALNLLIAAMAYWWSTRETPPEERRSAPPPPREPGIATAPDLERRMIWLLAFASGLLVLALEVLWTRMFAQVLQNSVYTFAAILAVFLLALALGSALAHLLCRLGLSPSRSIVALLTTSGLLVGLSPAIFYRLTSGLEFLGAGKGWSGYLLSVVTGTAAVLLIPGIFVGSVFPYLIKASEKWMESAGKTIGQLVAVNTLAAILGSLLAGFFLLDALGLWASLRLVAAAYLVLALVAAASLRERRLLWLGGPLLGLVLLNVFLTYDDFSDVRLDREHNEELVDLREGALGTVAVIRRAEDLRMKVDNSYLLGTSRSTPNLRLQSWIPMGLHPAPKSVFYLGMGTGITAGGSLDFPVERVVVTELNPDVVELAALHFEPYLNGLFEDPRVDVLAEDGRAYLAGTGERFDVIIADIFLTYRAGVGSLYTRDHFETVRARLASGGLFAQWLPVFELSQRELGIIAHTMLEVFPQVTVWRRGFSPRFPLMALIGQTDQAPLDAGVLDHNLDGLRAQPDIPERLWYLEIPLAAYLGNATEARALFDDYPLATDDRPLVEYLSPITNRQNWGAGEANVLAWAGLAELVEELQLRVLPQQDPYLSRLKPAVIDQVSAGRAFYEFETYRQLGRDREARAALEMYQQLVAGSDGQEPGGF